MSGTLSCVSLSKKRLVSCRSMVSELFSKARLITSTGKTSDFQDFIDPETALSAHRSVVFQQLRLATDLQNESAGRMQGHLEPWIETLVQIWLDILDACRESLHGEQKDRFDLLLVRNKASFEEASDASGAMQRESYLYPR